VEVKSYMNSYEWSTVLIVLENKVYCVTSSDGMLFPSKDEIQKKIKKNPHSICELKFR
jgi:hypothetical protein